MQLLEPRPSRAYFRCECGQALNFLTFDRPGDRKEVRCPACSRVWEQRLFVDEGGRGWERTLLKGPQGPTKLQTALANGP